LSEPVHEEPQNHHALRKGKRFHSNQYTHTHTHTHMYVVVTGWSFWQRRSETQNQHAEDGQEWESEIEAREGGEQVNRVRGITCIHDALRLHFTSRVTH
jgi:hypothetical protein